MKKLLVFLLFAFTSVIYSQKFNLGKVTKAELLETKHKTDTAATAAIIFKKEKTTFQYSEENGFTSYTVFQIKLKIYKKEGLNWANYRIPYYVGYKTLEDDYIDIVSAFTYNLENDKVVKDKVTSEGKFKEAINEYWSIKSLTFPNVKPGSIIELEYKLKTQSLSEVPEFKFQYSIPVDYAEYESKIPEFYIYKGIKRGYLDLEITQKLEFASQSFQSKAGLSSTSRTLSYKVVATTYKISNVPALKEEDFVNNIDNYYGSIEHELQMIRFPNEPPKQIATNWSDVAKSIYEDKDFNTAIKKSSYFASHLRAQIDGADNAQEMTKKIFNYVKVTMNWNGIYGYYPKRDLEVAYAEKTGNVAEINLMLVSMLKMAGIEANPVLVSTRDNGVAFFPNRSIFNYVIVAVNIGGQITLLDATSKNADVNVLPIRALNWSGRLIQQDGSSKEIELMPKTNSEDVVTAMATITTLGEVTGKVRETYFNYNALSYRDKYGILSKESHTERLERKYQGVEISDLAHQNIDDLTKPVTENYTFNSTNVVEIIGNKMYFSPFLFFAQTENPFKQEEREYPIDFAFPYENKYTANISIPEGYAVETLPESKAVTMVDNLGSFKYNISNSEGKIQLQAVLDINQAVISADYYQALKDFFKEVVDKQTERIVLKKI